jgi:peroxiredoxin
MGPRLSVFVGLVAGVLVALAVLAVVILAVPAALPPAPASPSASAAAVVGSPSVSPAPSASAVASPSGSPSPVPSGAPVPSGSSSVAANFHVGQAAPALSVAQVGGGTIELSALKGKSVWINFMQTTCLPCIDEFPHMNSFATRYADAGLVVIAIDIKEDEAAALAFAQRLDATFALGLDTTGEAQQAWGAYGLPVHFWIDKTGIVRDGALGGIGPDVMAHGVAAILPGVTVTP